VSSKSNTTTGASLAAEVRSFGEAYRSSYQFLDKYRELKTQEPTDNPIPNIYAQVANAELRRYVGTLRLLIKRGEDLNRQILVFLERHRHDSLFRSLENSRFSQDVAGTLTDLEFRHIVNQFLEDLASRLENLPEPQPKKGPTKADSAKAVERHFDREKFAETISVAMRSAGHNQDEAAEEIGISTKTLRNYLDPDYAGTPQKGPLRNARRYIRHHPSVEAGSLDEPADWK